MFDTAGAVMTFVVRVAGGLRAVASVVYERPEMRMRAVAAIAVTIGLRCAVERLLDVAAYESWWRRTAVTVAVTVTLVNVVSPAIVYGLERVLPEEWLDDALSVVSMASAIFVVQMWIMDVGVSTYSSCAGGGSAATSPAARW